MNVKCILGALLCAPLTVSGAEWFEANTPLIQAHQHLLNNDLANMFTSMVLVWQNNNTPTNKAHLNDLFNQSITANCGKGLDTSPLPEWLKNITIRRINIQSLVERRISYWLMCCLIKILKIFHLYAG
jgi:hypothetical protein